MSANQRFKRGSGAYTCRRCGKLTRETGACESNVDLCASCFDLAGIENEHADGYHADEPNAECPLCARANAGEVTR